MAFVYLNALRILYDLRISKFSFKMLFQEEEENSLEYKQKNCALKWT